MVIEKSANQLWRESGTTLSFKDWLTREKKKFDGGAADGVMMMNKPLNETIEETLAFTGTQKRSKENKLGSTLGVSNLVWVIAGLAIGGFIVYQIVKKKK